MKYLWQSQEPTPFLAIAINKIKKLATPKKSSEFFIVPKNPSGFRKPDGFNTRQQSRQSRPSSEERATVNRS